MELGRSNMPCTECKKPLPEGSHSNRRYCPTCNELRKRFNEAQKNKARSIRHTFRNIREDILKNRNTDTINNMIIEEIELTKKIMLFQKEQGVNQ